MRKRVLFVLMVLMTAAVGMLMFSANSAWAHSTKGRIKVQLTKATPTVDDMAYFIEYYVHKVKYAKQYKNTKNRFYLREFLRIDQEGDTAEVFFTVQDFKANKRFDDSLRFVRNQDHTWSCIQADGEIGPPIYTYMKKYDYYSQKYILPVATAGLMLAGGVFVYLRIKRKGKKKS